MMDHDQQMQLTDQEVRPDGSCRMRMTWRNLLFMHWPCPAVLMQSLLPPGLVADTYDGMAWVGLVPFTMTGVRHRGSPPVPTMHAFHECNVRTYVRLENDPDDAGVYFFSLDAMSRLAVWGARTFWNLPYFHSSITLDRRGDETEYIVRRNGGGETSGLSCSWRAGDTLDVAVPGTLRWFLTERYQLFSQSRKGVIRSSRIWHERWPLRSAHVHSVDDSLVEAAGLPCVAGMSPVDSYHAECIEVEAWGLKEV